MDAYVGCGVWALVWQTLLNSIILTILFYCLVHWKPLHTSPKVLLKDYSISDLNY